MGKHKALAGDSQQAFRMNFSLQIVPQLPKVRGDQPSPGPTGYRKRLVRDRHMGQKKKIMKAAFCRKE